MLVYNELYYLIRSISICDFWATLNGLVPCSFSSILGPDVCLYERTWESLEGSLVRSNFDKASFLVPSVIKVVFFL